MPFWTTKVFKSLKNEWEEKLKQSGFVDIETTNENLKQNSVNCYTKADSVIRENKLSYYLLVNQKLEKDRFFENLNFFDYIDQVTMILHSKGDNIQEICAYLETLGVKKDRKMIRYIIRRWQFRWRIRTWTNKEMNTKE